MPQTRQAWVGASETRRLHINSLSLCPGQPGAPAKLAQPCTPAPCSLRAQLGPTAQRPGYTGTWSRLLWLVKGNGAQMALHTHVHTKSTYMGPVSLLPGPPALVSMAQGLHTRFASLLLNLPRTLRINSVSPWLVPLSPSSGVPNSFRAKGHRSGVQGSHRAELCSAPRPAGGPLWRQASGLLGWQRTEQGRRGGSGAEATERHPFVQRSQPGAEREGREWQDVTGMDATMPSSVT